METEGSSPHSQAHATCPYPEPAPSSPHTHFPKMTWQTTTTCFYLEPLYNAQTKIEDNTRHYANDQKPCKAQSAYLLTRPLAGCPSNQSSISGTHNRFISSTNIHAP